MFGMGYDQTCLLRRLSCATVKVKEEMPGRISSDAKDRGISNRNLRCAFIL